jgi:heme-degrading monooxygenase HmoA
MIARMWRGVVAEADADEYATYIERTGIEEYTQTPGNRGLYFLRRDYDGKSEFRTFSLWDDLDAVRAFAGDDYERSVYYPEDDRYLIEKDEHVLHFEVLSAP